MVNDYHVKRNEKLQKNRNSQITKKKKRNRKKYFADWGKKKLTKY